MTKPKSINSLMLLALDPDAAHVRDDGFYCKKTKYGYELFIGVVIPPIEFIKKERIELSINSLLNKSKDLPHLFSKNVGREYSLKENGTRPVLLAKYCITDKGKMLQETVSSCFARTKWINHNDHDEGIICVNAFNAVKLIHQNHSDGERLTDKSKRWNKHDLSFDHQLSNELCDLFSCICRVVCKINDVPYYHPVRPDSILVSDKNNGRFQRPIRDVLALINLRNLNNFILGKKDCILREEKVIEMLGSKHRILHNK